MLDDCKKLRWSEISARSEAGLPTVLNGDDIASVKSGIFYWFYNEQTNC